MDTKCIKISIVHKQNAKNKREKYLYGIINNILTKLMLWIYSCYKQKTYTY